MNKVPYSIGEAATAVSSAMASIGNSAAQAEHADAHGRYDLVCHEALPGCEQEYMALIARIETLDAIEKAKLESVRRVKWRETAENVVCTLGKNAALDAYLAGSAYTAAWFLGLISSVSFTAVAAADTMASHAGWLESGATNAPTYSGARKTAAWAAASAGSKALSAGLVFTFTGTGTVKGAFLTSVATVDGTTGVLYSAGLFTGGDQPVVATNTLTVSYTASL